MFKIGILLVNSHFDSGVGIMFYDSQITVVYNSYEDILKGKMLTRLLGWEKYVHLEETFKI